MTANTDKKENSTETGRQLRALAARDDNRRRLQALPFFRTEEETPDSFERLLERLDSAEAARAG
jgi:hypothetical protein